MEKIQLPKASVLTSPNPVTLVCTQRPDGTTNLATVSWWTYLSNRPPMVAFCAKSTGYTGECVARSKSFALCVVDDTMKEKAFQCGTASGRNVDKAEALNIEMIPCREDGLMAVKNSAVIFVCSLEQSIPAGDHTIHIGKVEKVLGDPDKKHLSAYNGYQYLDV